MNYAHTTNSVCIRVCICVCVCELYDPKFTPDISPTVPFSVLCVCKCVVWCSKCSLWWMSLYFFKFIYSFFSFFWTPGSVKTAQDLGGFISRSKDSTSSWTLAVSLRLSLSLMERIIHRWEERKEKVWSWRDENDLRREGIREIKHERNSRGAREYINSMQHCKFEGGGGVGERYITHNI